MKEAQSDNGREEENSNREKGWRARHRMEEDFSSSFFAQDLTLAKLILHPRGNTEAAEKMSTFTGDRRENITFLRDLEVALKKKKNNN